MYDAFFVFNVSFICQAKFSRVLFDSLNRHFLLKSKLFYYIMQKVHLFGLSQNLNPLLPASLLCHQIWKVFFFIGSCLILCKSCAKGQLTSEMKCCLQISKKANFFWRISAPATKMDHLKKIMAHYHAKILTKDWILKEVPYARHHNPLLIRNRS